MTPPQTTIDRQNAPTAAPPSIFQRPARTLAHALGILLLAQLAAPLVGERPLPAILVQYARPAMFVPWSIALAGALNADRITLTILAVAIVLTNWPDQLLPSALASIFGMTIGTAIRALIIREYTNG